jgi:O-methyltransferase
MTLKRSLAAAVVPHPIDLFDKLNWNARVSLWLSQHPDLPSFKDRFGVYDYVGQQIGSQPIDFLEFGVFRGESFKYWLGLNQNPESRFTGFDTFTGLPEQWENFDAGAFDTDGATPETGDKRARFDKGMFQDTLYDFLDNFSPRRQLVIHIDCDLFSSTLFVLAALDRFIVPGTIIMFDEFASIMHEFRAWNEYLPSFQRSATAIARTDRFLQVSFRIDH